MRIVVALTIAIFSLHSPAINTQELPSLEAGIAALDSHDYELAFNILLPLAEAGNSDAQSKIAHMYYWAEGRPRNDEEHFRWSLLSAQAGNPIGQFDVAADYFSGRGVTANIKAGMKWATLAADGGDSYAQYTLAAQYLAGTQFAESRARGEHYLNLATAQNEPRALLLAAIANLRGEYGFDVNRGTALDFLIRAANLQNTDAQLVLGAELAGTAQSDREYSEAVKWLLVADRAGCDRAGNLLTPFAMVLKAATMGAAVSLAEEWERDQAAKAPHDHRSYLDLFCTPSSQIEALRRP